MITAEQEGASRVVSPPQAAVMESGWRTPILALVCALVAVVNTAVWSVVLPLFEVPDEPDHAAYVQHLAETGRPVSHRPGPQYSSQLRVSVDGSRVFRVINHPQEQPPWLRADDQRIREALSRKLARDNGFGFSNAANNPPLYYTVEAATYLAAGSKLSLNALLAMRLTSALLGGLAVFLIFLFLAELFPRERLVQVVGTLAAALTPVFAFITGGINNDAGLFAAAAGTFWATAVMYRRGLSAKTGARLGAIVGLGLITKVNLAGFLPGVALAALLLTCRQWKTGRSQALWGWVGGVVSIASPVAVYVLLATQVWHHPLWTGAVALAGPSIHTHAPPEGVGGLFSYLWHFYIPTSSSLDAYPAWRHWFKGLVGCFGWQNYGFPEWVYRTALVCFICGSALVCRGVWNARSAARRRLGEVLTYFVFVCGLLFLVGAQGYRYRVEIGLPFEQGRYVLPLLALYGVAIALAIRGVRVRWRSSAAVIVMMLTLVHGLGALLITFKRYYA